MCRDAIADLLDEWLARRATPEARAWLSDQVARLGNEAPARQLALAFSAAVRRFGKAPLGLDPAELEQAAALLPGWRPQDWTAAQVARARILLCLRMLGPAELLARLDDLAACADLDESIAIYASLALLPHGEQLVARARVGLRSNAPSVFAAVACDSPMPARHFDENAWNQMMLKAFFIDCDVRRIHGLEQRHNIELARMLGQYARERWAASRPISPQLWRFLACAKDDPDRLADLQRAAEEGPELQRLAARLALGEAQAVGVADWSQMPMVLEETIP